MVGFVSYSISDGYKRTVTVIHINVYSAYQFHLNIVLYRFTVQYFSFPVTFTYNNSNHNSNYGSFNESTVDTEDRPATTSLTHAPHQIMVVP